MITKIYFKAGVCWPGDLFSDWKVEENGCMNMSRQKPYLHMFYGIKDFSSNNCVEEKQQENEEKDVTC